MRVIDRPPPGRVRTPASSRAAQLECLGLIAGTVLVLLGLALAYVGKTESIGTNAGSRGATGPVNLRQLRAPSDLLPLLEMFEDPVERRAAALALYRRAADRDQPLEHVGGLARVTLPADRIRSDRRYVQLGSRLERRPTLQAVPVLTSADLATLKPRLIVRTPDVYRAAVLWAGVWLFGAFWCAHAARRLRGTIGDPVALPVVLLLCGMGLASLIALRDPLRDTLAVSGATTGIVAGLALMVLVSEVDFEASPLRRAVLGPLAVAIALASLLLLFGTGPGTSGARLRLFVGQPADVIRLLVVLALAAHFARRGEFLREYSQESTASRPWLHYLRMPRWKDVGPAIASIGIVIAFFFLQRDLGPALVLACVFLAMYGVARHRAVLATGGLIVVLCGFGVAYWTGIPATVGQRVAIWLDPWSNGVPGGDQVAQGLWALSTGSAWGSGLGRGATAVVPAADTDFILAAVGEELGFVGVTIIVVLYGILCWRCVRAALRAPGEYTALVALGIALTFVVQGCVIASGVLGLLPLSGVVTPFLSYGRSAMVANLLALGVVLAIAKRQGPPRPQLAAAVRVLCLVLAAAGGAVLARAGWIQVVHADTTAAAASLTEQADGVSRFAYNPRLVAAAQRIERGSIYDRNGVALATSKPLEIEGVAAAYRKAGITPGATCTPAAPRCYPLGAAAVHVIGDWPSQANWGAPNSSYVERDSDSRLKGFDDRPRTVEVVNPRTGAHGRATLRDYRVLLPLARDTYRRNAPAVRALLDRDRDVALALDARLQARAAAALARGIERGHHARGAAAVIDVASGDVLASVSYPQPSVDELRRRAQPLVEPDASERLLDRARYGLYPPGSAFKVLVAAAALRTAGFDDRRTFACVRLPDGRVGNYVGGWPRPVRDDPMDHVPHGAVHLRQGLVVSCNAYFAQLATALGPQPLLDAASVFGIDVARPQTAGRLRRSLAHAGYGQGEVVVSPLKMARVAAAVAHGGLVTPVTWVRDPAADSRSARHRDSGERGDVDVGSGFSRLLSPRDADVLGEYLRGVVTSGTGRALASNTTPIAGKTGTAEVDGRAAHSWFAGYAPYGGRRRIAFAVIVENAGYGARAAAPIAGELVTAARDLGLVE
jgi:cell division protein FtsW (lipid II flippase)/cell division protein FtsI/penicillin-binding protein 2